MAADSESRDMSFPLKVCPTIVMRDLFIVAVTPDNDLDSISLMCFMLNNKKKQGALFLVRV